MSNELTVHSPAEGVDSIPSPGSGSTPAAPSIHPDVNVYGDTLSSTSPAGAKDCEQFAGVAPTGDLAQVQLAEGAPEAYGDAGLGETLVGGLGDPPRP